MSSDVRHCYVAIFDVLGFKALRAREGTMTVARVYDRSLLATIQHAAAGSSRLERRGDHEVSVPLISTQSIGYRVISDTVLFLGRDDSFASFFSIVSASCHLLQAGFGNGKTPFRGAIGHGDLYDDGDITVGSAIEDAHSGETSQLWAGAMFTPGAAEHAAMSGHFDTWMHVHEEAARSSDPNQAANARRNGRRIVRYDVPRKPRGERLSAHVLDWTLHVFSGASANALPPCEDEHATAIRSNTMAFEQWARGRG